MPFKRTAKKYVNQGRRWWHTTFHSFTVDDIRAGLKALGVRGGDTLLAHVAYNRFLGFTGTPSDVVRSLRLAVGPDGTILMPSMPFGGTAVSYVESGQTFDVRRTPSQMGLVTEIFRRSPETLRSAHPTHPILASGPLAENLLSEHLLARTPCGAHSPFSKLSDLGGKIALLGTGVGALTFYHYIEEVLESALPRSPFTERVYHIEFRGREGELLSVDTRLFAPEVSRRRDLRVLEKELKANDCWRERTIGNVSFVVLEAQAVSDTVRTMAQRGVFCYG